MEGGTGEWTGDLSPSAGGLIPGGVTVLNNTRGVAAQSGWGASCSRDNSRWCSVTSNTREEWLEPLAGSRLFPG